MREREKEEGEEVEGRHAKELSRLCRGETASKGESCGTDDWGEGGVCRWQWACS